MLFYWRNVHDSAAALYRYKWHSISTVYLINFVLIERTANWNWFIWIVQMWKCVLSWLTERRKCQSMPLSNTHTYTYCIHLSFCQLDNVQHPPNRYKNRTPILFYLGAFMSNWNGTEWLRMPTNCICLRISTRTQMPVNVCYKWELAKENKCYVIHIEFEIVIFIISNIFLLNVIYQYKSFILKLS